MSICPSNWVKSQFSIETETLFELSTNAKSMVIKLFHDTVGVNKATIFLSYCL